MTNNVVCYSKYNIPDNSFIDVYQLTEKQPACIYTTLTPLFFVCFTLTGQFIMMNVIVAIVTSQLEVILR